MSPSERCEEILRIIDEALAAQPRSPARGVGAGLGIRPSERGALADEGYGSQEASAQGQVSGAVGDVENGDVEAPLVFDLRC